eukprot:TRINITY_DN18043_c0_g1_i4.p2 TRINITY_DN18043_c0_g1~~TRINITY_DN18043_c0_g1_i4.p2  ORF type:complete len:157 (+),score=25.66 TRINITY_DN18043_c0_g1_i4:112-582(+)
MPPEADEGSSSAERDAEPQKSLELQLIREESESLAHTTLGFALAHVVAWFVPGNEQLRACIVINLLCLLCTLASTVYLTRLTDHSRAFSYERVNGILACLVRLALHFFWAFLQPDVTTMKYVTIFALPVSSARVIGDLRVFLAQHLGHMLIVAWRT